MELELLMMRIDCKLISLKIDKIESRVKIKPHQRYPSTIWVFDGGEDVLRLMNFNMKQQPNYTDTQAIIDLILICESISKRVLHTNPIIDEIRSDIIVSFELIFTTNRISRREMYANDLIFEYKRRFSVCCIKALTASHVAITLNVSPRLVIVDVLLIIIII